MAHHQDQQFNWTDPNLVAAFDDLSLWSSLAGSLLLDHVPLQPNIRVLDVGCGSGFPLLELAERLGTSSTISGLDPWEAALSRAAQKSQLRSIRNVELVKGDAANMPWPDSQFDLIVSNLGINNFDDRAAAMRECFRVAKPAAVIALATNLVGHMQEFYDVFRATLIELAVTPALQKLDANINHRSTLAQVESLLSSAGFAPHRSFTKTVVLRFADGTAMLWHSLIRAGFLDQWRDIVKAHDVEKIFARLEANLNRTSKEIGELRLTIPLAYVEAKKPQR